MITRSILKINASLIQSQDSYKEAKQAKHYHPNFSIRQRVQEIYNNALLIYFWVYKTMNIDWKKFNDKIVTSNFNTFPNKYFPDRAVTLVLWYRCCQRLINLTGCIHTKNTEHNSFKLDIWLCNPLTKGVCIKSLLRGL